MTHLQTSAAVEQIQVPAWAWALVAFALAGLYALAFDNGALLADKASLVHEFVHDARHFIGAPCH